MKLRQTISLILACMMAAVQPSSIVYASDIENNITQESVGDVGSNTENVEDINESTEAVNENESVEISDDTQSNDTENSMEENTANQQDNGTVEDEITDDIFSDGSTGNNLSASEDYLSDLTVRDNDNKDDNTNNEAKNLLSANVILPNGQTDKVTVSRKNGFNEGDKLIVNYLEGEELDKCINGINDTKNANQDSKNDSDVEIDSILPLHMVIADANGNEIQGEENYEIKISEANTNSAEFFKNLKLFHQKQTGEWEEISWNTGNDAETGLTFIDWTSQNLGNFVFVKEKVQSVKNEEADVTVEDTKSIAVSDESDIEQKKVDEKSDAKYTCDTNTDNAYKHAWNCPVFLEQLKKDCTCDSEDEKVTSHDFECEAFKKAITEICTCETKDTPGMHDNCEVIRRMHDELCNCGRKYDSVDDIIDNHEKDSNVVTYLMKWADYANQPEIIATTYTIKYNLNGGSISGQKTKYTSTTATFTLPTPRRTGYTFTGWTGTGLSSATKTVTIKKGSKGNRTYTAHWSVNNYRFDINGWLDGQDLTYITGYGTMDVYLNGSMFANDVGDFCDNYPYGTTYTITDIKPTPGHTYNGVQSGSLSGTIGAGLTKVSLNFTSNHYRLTLNPNGGAFSDGSTGARALTGADLIYGHGNWNNLAGNPVTRYNCNFAGWYTAPSGGTKLYDANGACLESSYWSNNQYYGTSDLTVYAQWYPYVHTVAYNANGGTGAPASQTKTYLVQLNLSTTKPIRTGYTFASWNTAADGSGTKWNPGDNYTPDYNGGTVTLYAQWTKDTYTISYNLNGGKISGQKTSYDVTTEAFTLPTPVRGGYTFSGWTGTGLSSATKTVTVAKGSAGNRSYTANWSAKIYTIYFDYNKPETDGTVGGAGTTSKSVRFDSTYGALPSPSLDGYTFDGWYTAASNGIKISSGTTYKTGGSTRLYAHWTLNAYSISYTLNGGSISGQPTSYNVNTATFTLPTPTRVGYIFTGWTGSNGTTAQKSVSIAKNSTGNKSYTANWSLNTYTISYTLNGGNISGQKTSYDVTTEAFTLPTPTRNGYTFTGWTGTGLSSATKTVTVAKGSTGNRSYTANWSANVLTINYHNDGATGFKWSDDSKYDDITGKDIILTEKYSYDSEYGPVYGLPDTSRLYKIGYHYDGYWYLDKKNSSVKVSDQLKLPKTQDVANAFGKLTDFEKGNTTIDVYASLIPNVLTVNYYPNGATKIDKSNDEDGSDIIDIDSNVVYKTEEFKYDTEMRNYGLDDSRRFIRAGYHSENTYTVDSYDSKVSLNAGSGIYANTQDMAKTAGKLTDLENGNVTINIYAYWIPNTYVIKYNGNGSTSGSMTDSSCTYDTAFSLSKNTFSRKGYLFCGWNTQSDGKGTPYKDNESIKNLSSENEKTIILYAQWTPIKYTVKYDANGGTGEVPADTTHTFNEKGTIYPENALAKNAFTRKGYKFSGWNASRVKDGKIEWYYDNWNWYEEGKNPKSASKYVWTDGGDTHNASDVNGDILTMHAQWKANTLTINYHNDNGATWRQYPDDSTIDVSNKDIVQSETVTYDEKYKHYEFGLIDAGRLTKAGYHLNNGWKINSMDSKTIVPDTNGSMNSYENSGKGVADFLGVLTGFEKGDVTVDLYPDIAINTGTVHYYPNSNEAVAKAGYDQYITNGEFAGSLATTTSFDYKTTGGSGANTLTDVYTLFERKGYHQSAAQNWHYGSPDSDVYFHCDEEDLSPYVKDATDVHLKLYANWISNDYAVKFDGNGSTSGNMTDVTCKYDESFNLTENKFVRNNYEFIGWNTKKDGSGQDYKDKESVKNLTDEDNGTVTLYAQWKLKKYTLTVSHTISGNMGNRDKDFSFTMSLSNSNKDAVIPENIEAVFMDDIGNKSKKLFTVVDEKVTFTLSHKESIIFKDIPYETLYTISEDNENEYDVTNESASGTITKNIEVSFVSTKNGTVPTSSDTLNLYPIIMIAFAGIIYVILSQRKKKIKQKR